MSGGRRGKSGQTWSTREKRRRLKVLDPIGVGVEAQGYVTLSGWRGRSDQTEMGPVSCAKYITLEAVRSQ